MQRQHFCTFPEYCNTYLERSNFVLSEKVQYSGPKFMTLCSEPFCHAYDVISLNSMNDVTKDDNSFHFQDKTLFFFLYRGAPAPKPQLCYSNIISSSVLEHILGKNSDIFYYFMDAKYGHTFGSAILHYTPANLKET